MSGHLRADAGEHAGEGVLLRRVDRDADVGGVNDQPQRFIDVGLGDFRVPEAHALGDALGDCDRGKKDGLAIRPRRRPCPVAVRRR